MGSKQKTKIVFFDVCGGATKFTSQELAEEAAEVYGRNAGYRCEAFQCENKCESKRHGVVYHVRGKVRHTSPTGGPGRQFQSSTVPEQLDKALGATEPLRCVSANVCLRIQCLKPICPGSSNQNQNLRLLRS